MDAGELRQSFKQRSRATYSQEQPKTQEPSRDESKRPGCSVSEGPGHADEEDETRTPGSQLRISDPVLQLPPGAVP